MELRSCGFACIPASAPEEGEPYDCNHADASHYGIDGEAAGCIECETQDDPTFCIECYRELAQYGGCFKPDEHGKTVA